MNGNKQDSGRTVVPGSIWELIMNTTKRKIEPVAKVLLYLGIASYIILNADTVDAGIVVFYLGLSAVIWAVLWFLYVFVRDAIIALGWKKPEYSLPQYEREDVEMHRVEEINDGLSLSLSDTTDPHDPSFRLFDK